VRGLARSSKLGEARVSERLQIDVLILGHKSPLVAAEEVEPHALPGEGHLFDRDLAFQSRCGFNYVYDHLHRIWLSR